MRTRDTAVLITIVLALAATLLLFTRGGSGPEPAPTPIVPAVDDVPEDDAAPPVSVAVDAGQGPAPAQADARGGVEHTGPPPEWGVVEGRVSVSTELLGSVSSFRVRITELVNPNASSDGRTPYDRVAPRAFPVPQDHTPRFRVEEIPFSRFGYRVELIAAGCNGSSQIVRLAPDSPFAEVTLALTPPAPFVLRLRDQHANPHANWRIELRPSGDPPGRAAVFAETDRFGSVVLEGVVRGEYEVWHEGHALETVTVQASTSVARNRPISPQAAIIVVPVGMSLRVETFGPAGIGIEEVNLSLYRVDTTELRRHEAATGYGGVHVFEHLEQGRYQLDVWKDGMQRQTKTLRIPEDAEQPLKLVLIPLR